MAARPRVDWAEAFAYYAALKVGERTFPAVANRFGVSDTAVRGHAKREHWDERLAELEHKARVKAERLMIDSEADRIADTYLVVQKARRKVLRGLDNDTIEVKLSDLPALLKIEQLLDGRATEIIEPGQVRMILMVVAQGGPPIFRNPELTIEQKVAAFFALMEGAAGQLPRGTNGEAA